MTGTTTAERLAWALDRLDECGQRLDFSLGMFRSLADCREHLSAPPDGGGEELIAEARGFINRAKYRGEEPATLSLIRRLSSALAAAQEGRGK